MFLRRFRGDILSKGLTFTAAVILVVMLSGCSSSDEDVVPADLVIQNAKVFTSDDQNPWAEAVAVRDQRVCYVGPNTSVASYMGPETEIIDAKGNMLVPGFVDNHCHVLWMGGITAIMASLYEAASIDDIKTIITAYAAENPDSPCVMGMGWVEDYIPGKHPDKALADSILKDRPLILWAAGGHNGWLNSMALQDLKDRNSPAFEHLSPEIDETTGEPTGWMLHFYAFNPLDFYSLEELGEDLRDRMYQAMSAVLEEALSVGVTTLNDVQIYKTFIPLVTEFQSKGGFSKIRVKGSFYVGNHALEDTAQLLKDLNEWIVVGKQYSTPNFYLGDSVKLYIDGVGGNYTSFMLDPYADKPGEYGYALWSQEDLDRVMEIIDGLRLQALIHCSGDAGTRRIINAYEHVWRLNGTWDSRHRIEHCELVKGYDLQRMAQLDIYAAMQPSHLNGDQRIVEVLGAERLNRWMPWKSMEEAGIELSYGSDWSAAPLNPMYGLATAGTRINYTGKPSWGPQEKIAIENAFRYYTIGSAKALKLENDIGSIERGKYADFALFSMDLREVISEEFLSKHPIKPGTMEGFVLMTIVGGEIVYQKPETAVSR